MRPALVLVPQYFGSTVFDRRTSRYMPFDRETTDLLTRSVETPFDFFIDSECDSERRRRLERFFEHFESKGFFTTNRRFYGSVLDVTPPRDHLTGPLAVHLEVVAACNLTCTHCFAGELPRREEPLSLADLDRLFATLARMGAFRLGLTGGEPLLRRDLFEILDLATHHGLHPCLTTNGLLVTEPIAREFGKRELAWLNVSLDGATAESNDRVRGAGTFARVLEKLELLRRYARFTLAFTIMSHNAAEVGECAKLAARVGAHSAVFRPLYPVGTASHHRELMPSFDQYSSAVHDLAELGGDLAEACEPPGGFELRSVDPFGPGSRAEARSVVHQNYGCGAGNLVCSISVSGDVNPCSFLGNAFVAANVRHRTFEEIWHDSNVFREIRGLPGDGSGTTSFGGGCRARALVLAGDANAPDPWLAARASGALHPLVVIERRPRSGT
ncbi:MAG TPA: radical SAM protein [Planctomycetota bacterium]|nr:radical SAM protein [Planctomycetota bacterium]